MLLTYYIQVNVRPCTFTIYLDIIEPIVTKFDQFGIVNIG